MSDARAERPATRAYVDRQDKVLLRAICDRLLPRVLKLERYLAAKAEAEAVAKPRYRVKAIIRPIP